VTLLYALFFLDPDGIKLEYVYMQNWSHKAVRTECAHSARVVFKRQEVNDA